MHSTAIAARAQVSASSANDALNRLAERGAVEKRKDAAGSHELEWRVRR